MTLKDQVLTAIRSCITSRSGCESCPYDKDEDGITRDWGECVNMLLSDFDLLISDMENTIKLLEEKE